MADSNVEIERGQGGGAEKQQAITRKRDGGMDGGSPLSMMRRLSDDLDRLFEGFLGGGLSMPRFELSDASRALWAPRIDLERRDDALVLHADLPGVKQEDIELSLSDDILTLAGERKDEREEQQGRYYHSERTYGSFSRSIRLPEGVNADQVKASFKDGVLDVEVPLPKEARSSAKRIAIGSRGGAPAEKSVQ